MSYMLLDANFVGELILKPLFLCDFTGTNPSSNYQRLGPGFSVLDPEVTNTTNSNIEMFRALAESIEKTLAEDIEEEVNLMELSVNRTPHDKSIW